MHFKFTVKRKATTMYVRTKKGSRRPIQLIENVFV